MQRCAEELEDHPASCRRLKGRYSCWLEYQSIRGGSGVGYKWMS